MEIEVTKSFWDKEFGRVKEAVRDGPFGKSKLQELINSGTIKSKLVGSTRVIDVQSYRDLLKAEEQTAREMLDQQVQP